MKRHSLVGPILLILFGALFLAHNLRPELISFEMIARHWPFLLIGWGALRLLEILVWRLGKKPLPANGISGGEWVFIALLCLVGSGLFAVYRHGPRLHSVFTSGRAVDLFGESYDFPVSEQKPAAKISRVVIENLRGNTRIIGADVEEIKVEGRKTIRAFEESEAAAADKKTPIEIIRQGEEILVRTNQEEVSGQGKISMDLQVTVPRNAGIQARGRYGDFDVVNISGNVDISSRNAGVRLQDIGGDAHIDLGRSDVVRVVNLKGKVEILGNGRDVELENVGGTVLVNGYFSGDFECRNLAKPVLFQSGQTELSVEGIPGKLQMDLSKFSASDVVGPVRLTAKSRDIQLANFTNSVKLSISRGDIEIDPRKDLTADIDARTRNGDIELTLPVSAKFQLEASTDSGSVNNEFGPSLAAKTEGRGSILSGSIGKGPRITVKTERGSITVGKG